MDWTLEELYPHLLIPNMQEPKVVKCLNEMSYNYTQNREGLAEFFNTEEAISSYALFYMTTNAPKMNFILDQISEEVKEDMRGATFLDVGTGPGTYLLSWLNWLGETTEGKIWGVDTNPLMLKQAKALTDAFFPEQRVDFYDYIPHAPSGKKILFFGNAINEMGHEEALKIIKKWNPDYIWWIEPGTTQAFEHILKLRSAANELNYNPIFPCSKIDTACPMEGFKDWCHQTLRMTHQSSVERLSQLIKKDRRSMPLISHLYAKDKKIVEKNTARFIRFKTETKHSFNWEVCLRDSDENEGELALIQFEIPKKTLSKQEAKSFKKLSVGIKIDYEIIKKITENNWRVSIKLK